MRLIVTVISILVLFFYVTEGKIRMPKISISRPRMPSRPKMPTRQRMPSSGRSYSNTAYQKPNRLNNVPMRSQYMVPRRPVLMPRQRIVPVYPPRVPYIRPYPMMYWFPMMSLMSHRHYPHYSRSRYFYPPTQQYKIVEGSAIPSETAFFGCSSGRTLNNATVWCSSIFNSTMFRGDYEGIKQTPSDTNKNAIDIYIHTLSDNNNFQLLLYGLTDSERRERLSSTNKGTSIGKLLFDSNEACSPWNTSTPCTMTLPYSWIRYSAFEIVGHGDDSRSCLQNYWFQVTWFTDDFVSIFFNVSLDKEYKTKFDCPEPFFAAGSNDTEKPQMHICMSELLGTVNNSCRAARIDPLSRRRVQMLYQEPTYDYHPTYYSRYRNMKVTLVFILIVSMLVLSSLYFRYKLHIHGMFHRVWRPTAMTTYQTNGYTGVPMMDVNNNCPPHIPSQQHNVQYPSHQSAVPVPSPMPYPVSPAAHNQLPYSLTPQRVPEDKLPSYEEATRS